MLQANPPFISHTSCISAVEAFSMTCGVHHTDRWGDQNQMKLNRHRNTWDPKRTDIIRSWSPSNSHLPLKRSANLGFESMTFWSWQTPNPLEQGSSQGKAPFPWTKFQLCHFSNFPHLCLNYVYFYRDELLKSHPRYLEKWLFDTYISVHW